MKTPSEIAEDYIALWNETDAARRADRLGAQWSTEATYVDPLARVAGRAEVAGLIGAAQTRFPGFRFTPLGAADGYAEFVRFSWGLGPEGAEPIVKGSDVVRLEGERIAAVIGFLDLVPGQAQ
jgi:hypothetical protein